MNLPPLLSFEEFMRRALHDPASGYYSRNITGIGRSGDFTTVPIVSSALARAIAAWAARALRETRCRHLIELGPGDGSLGRAVWQHLPWHLRWQTQVHLVETSTPLRTLQHKLWKHRAQHHLSPAKALSQCAGNAVLFSNELIDAFPVRRFRRSNSGWQELMLETDGHSVVAENWSEAPELPLSSGFDSKHPVGRQVEIHDSFRQWLSEWLPEWRTGRMLTIDYGGPAETLYFRKPLGTIRGYLLQQRTEGWAIYGNPGRQDLTADVNFTDLIDWLAPFASSQHMQPLAEFIRPFLDPKSDIDARLADENGAGGAFQVLETRRAYAGL